MSLFRRKKTMICPKCGNTMIEQTNASVISGDGFKRYLYKCKKCKYEEVK